jgi:peptidoglycan/xylan/chitin deacetylase (PgdA/CDA1 family)
VLTFNLSIDFELGWGELTRAAHDDRFYRRVVGGLEHTPQILLALTGIPSTWGVVAGCCAESVDELQARVPAAFHLVGPQLAALAQRRRAYREVLFCADAVRTIGRSAGVELASHGFLHLLPAGVPTAVLRSDVTASVAALRGLAGSIESFIPPQNYEWPDEALVGTGIRYVRHTPIVCGYAYSDPRKAAKLARLWNDLVKPVSYGDGERPVRLLFLRIDRGARLWERQLRMIRRLLSSRAGSLYCFSHPHNLGSAPLVCRFAQLCEAVGEAAAAGRLTFGRFFRQLPVGQEVGR